MTDTTTASADEPADRPPNRPGARNGDVGRRSKLTPQLHTTIVNAVLAGNFLEVACRHAGIGVSTLHAWLARGADPNSDPAYVEFREAVETARATAEARMVAAIQRAANDGTWQAAAWYLERSAYQRWGRRQIITGEDGGPIVIDHNVRAEAESRFQALESRLLEVEAGDDDDPVAIPLLDTTAVIDPPTDPTPA